MSTTLNTPRIQPDETLYSYIARCQSLWGCTDHKGASYDWFGKEYVCIDQCLPTHVTAISAHARYDCSTLLTHHTAYPLHRIFNCRHEALKQAMLGDYSPNIANLSCASHLAEAKLNIAKYCPACRDEDMELLGVAYWHLPHQIAGVMACWKHRCFLIEQPYNSRRYVLPKAEAASNRILVCWARAEQSDFATYVHGLLCGQEPYNNACEPTVKDLLMLKGFVTANDRIRMMDVLRKVKQLESALGLTSILNQESVRSLANCPRLSIHPVKPIILRFALERLPNASPATLYTLPAREITDDTAEQTEALLRSYKFSMREISRRMKVSVGFIKQLAKREGIAVDERRKFITAEMQRHIIDSAIAGTDRNVIASRFAVSTAAVEQLIQSVKALSVWRQYLRMLIKRNDARKRLKSTIELHPGLSKTEIRKLVSQEYALLYKCDRAWLFEALPTGSKRKYYGFRQWLKRDQALLPKLREEIRRSLSMQGSLPSLKHIDHVLGGRGWFTSSIMKMPLCWRYYRRVRAKLPHK